MKNKKISAIIACYKDAQAIPIMHDRLTKVFKKIGVDYEIIFVNDGDDGSGEGDDADGPIPVRRPVFVFVL